MSHWRHASTAGHPFRELCSLPALSVLAGWHNQEQGRHQQQQALKVAKKIGNSKLISKSKQLFNTTKQLFSSLGFNGNAAARRQQLAGQKALGECRTPDKSALRSALRWCFQQVPTGPVPVLLATEVLLPTHLH